MAVVEPWLDCRQGLGINGRRRLFCTLEGRPLKPSYVRTLLPRLAGRVGIEKRVHPHGLRHAHAAELTAEGLPVNLIQAQLGHASLATTDTCDTSPLRSLSKRCVLGSGISSAVQERAGTVVALDKRQLPGKTSRSGAAE